MTLRDRFRQKKAEMVMLCGEMEKMIIAAYGIGQVAQPEPVLEDLFGPEPVLEAVQTPIDPIIGNEDVPFAEDELWFHSIEAPAPAFFMRPYRSAPDLGTSNARQKPPLSSMPAAHYLQYSGSRRPPSCVRPHPAGPKVAICCPTCCYRRCCCGVASCVCSGVCLALCCCNCTCFV